MIEIKFLYSSKLLLNIETGDNVSDVAKKMKQPMSNVSSKLQDLEKSGIIYLEKSGRYKLIVLTAKGLKLKSLLSEIQKILK